MRICSRAVEIDPYYGRAWALLAIAQSSLRYGFGYAVDDGVAASHAALAINPAIGEAHCAMARRLEEKGHEAEASAEIAEALRLAPDSWEVRKEAGRRCKRQRDFANARTHYEKAVELMESDFHSWAMLVTCYQALGQCDAVRHGAARMISEAQKALQQDPSNGAALGILAGGHAIVGDTDRAREWIERALLIDPDNVNMKYNFACVLAAYVGDKDEALHLLKRALATAGEMLLKVAEADPDLDCLRDDPDFRNVIRDAHMRFGIEQRGTPPPPSPPAAARAISTNS